ncbi:RNA-guided endonuclease TnpB family protein [Faecalibaculum rodentium]|uniref:RNA-guided endonuclease TnpB family protein n=1 Tax=Faecalibaculum rodentium TaxID=1702221 RepID=UPI0023F27265|nr:RNA-guided endonuclease TnpB family protein [Faecalibaculum rodentium]
MPDVKRKVRKTKRSAKDTLRRAYRYRLYPTPEQEALLSKTFGCCRFLWNRFLEDRETWWETNKSISPKDRVPLRQTPAAYKPDYPWLKEVDSFALCNVQMDFQQAWKNHFDNPKYFGRLRYKRKKAAQSYKTNSSNGQIRLVEGGIRLPKLGIVKARIHRLPEEGMQLKSATVSRKASGKYFVSVLFEKPCIWPETVDMYTAPAVGLDYKSDGLFVASDGSRAIPPRLYRKEEKRLAKAQRKLCRQRRMRKPGEAVSNNYLKQQRKVAAIHETIANRRNDFLQKLSAEMTNRYDIICIESLDMKAMSNKGFGNGKATMDNGWGCFTRMLEYKLKRKGGLLVKVDKWFPSSQLCSHCGCQNTAVRDLSIRKWECPCCGAVLDRDENAAANILMEGLRTIMAY